MKKEVIIKTTDLVAKYGNKTILDGISVEMYKGEVTVILGGSGCGKTTLIKNILRMYEPFSGKVEILNQDVTHMAESDFEAILKRTGMLFQNGALLNSISVFDNIAIPLEQHTKLPRSIIDRIIKTKLHLVNLDHALYLTPAELSGGMKKRAALARALALEPEIVFCDEPSAGLDPITSADLDLLFINLKKQLNMSLVIVTHELASIHRVADRIIFLDAGKLLFAGTLEDAKNANIPEVDKFFKIGSF